LRTGRLISAAAIALATVALAPAIARAESPPTVTSLSVNEGGSNGAIKMKVFGSEFSGASANGDVKFGTVALKHVSTITGKDQFRVVSASEIEVDNPLHERGRVAVTVTNAAGSSGSEIEPNAADEFTYLPEFYRNEVAGAPGSHTPGVAYGEIVLTSSPHPNGLLECVNLALGAGWNEGTPTTGRGEIIDWWASGHAPTEEHTELSSRCRVIYEGKEETEANSPEAWATAEPRLSATEQEGIVCRNKSFEALSQCPNSTEREQTAVLVGLHREALSTPWNFDFTERQGGLRVRIGLPFECAHKTGTERTELAKCPEASEREASRSPEGCVISASRRGPAPPGCVRMTIVATPTLNLELLYEGYVEPKETNGQGNGLSPGSWEFQGEGKEECLHLRTSAATQGCASGALKLIGFSGQELISVK
jgi:hypothetical protein